VCAKCYQLRHARYMAYLKTQQKTVLV
jgi:hypothetical protein